MAVLGQQQDPHEHQWSNTEGQGRRWWGSVPGLQSWHIHQGKELGARAGVGWTSRELLKGQPEPRSSQQRWHLEFSLFTSAEQHKGFLKMSPLF